MIRVRRKNTYIAFIVVGVLAILGITLASAFRVSKSTEVNVYPVTLDATIDLEEDLQDVVLGDTIVNGVSFSRATDSNDIYVRADLRYVATGTLSDEDKRFLLAINYDDVATFEGDSYKWVRAEDGYYYLTDLDGAPLKVTDSNKYIFCSGLTYQGAKCINNDAPAPATLKLNAELQAIHAKDVDSIALTDLSALFNTNFGTPPVLGYIVAFDTDGAGFVTAQTFLTNGLTVTVPPEPSKLDYEFVGWYTDPDFTNEYNFETIVDKSFTLYARFEQVHTITYISEGNTYMTTEVVGGSTPVAPTEPTSALENMTFKGWYLDSAFEKKYDFNTPITDDTILYAKFEREYTVTFISGDETYQIVKVPENTAVSEPNDPTHDNTNMVFVGWYTDTSYVTEYNFGTIVTSNFNLYALFKEQFTVTFISEGIQYSKVNVLNGEAILEPQPAPEKDGYEFVGWYTDVTLENEYDFNKPVTTNFNLYAKFVNTSIQIIENGLLVKEIKNNNYTLADLILFDPDLQNTYNFYSDEGLENSIALTDLLINGQQVYVESVTSGVQYTKITNENACMVGTGSSGSGYPTVVDTDVIIADNRMVDDDVYPVTELGYYAFSNKSKLTSVKIPNTITTLDTGVFNGCRELTSITIPEGVISIGNSAFKDCTGLIKINYNAINCADLSSYNNNAFNNVGGNSTGITVTIGKNVENIPAYLFYPGNTIYDPNITMLEFEPESICKGIGNYAFYGCSALNSISLGGDLTSIGNSAFSGCNYLTSVVIPNKVSSIGTSAFSGCIRLKNLTIGSGVLSIMDYAFSGCNSLVTITIPNNVTSIGENAFLNCSSATSLILGEGVTSIGDQAFNNCRLLTSIQFNAINCTDLSSQNSAFFRAGEETNGIKVTIGSKVTRIPAYLFCNSYNAANAFQVPNITTVEFVTDSLCASIGDYAFNDCVGLTSVDISNGVTSIGACAFRRCTGLLSVDIPKNVTTIGSGAFYGCSGLKGELIIPEGVTVINGTTFYGCSGLTSIAIPDGVTSIGAWAFRGCSGLISITIPDGVTSIGDYAFYGCSSLTGELVIPSGITSLGSYVFYGCRNLTGELIIPDGVTSISYSAFSGCNGFTSLTIPDSVASIGNNAFKDCYRLVQVINNSTLTIANNATNGYTGYYAIEIVNTNAGESVVGEFDTDNKYYIYNYDNEKYLVGLKDVDTTTANDIPAINIINQYAFYMCTNLTSITIPDSVTSIKPYALRGCSGLLSIVVDSNNTTYNSGNGSNAIIETSTNTLLMGCKNTIIPSTVTSIEDSAFRDCTSLINITIPDNVSDIGSYAFDGCTGLTSVTLGNGIKNIGYSIFNACTSLANVNIPNTVTRIDAYAFQGCSSLTNITIPNSVRQINSAAFKECTSLTNVVIPNSVTFLDMYVFQDCTSLISMVIPSSVTYIGSNAFDGSYFYMFCETEAVQTLATGKGLSASRILVKVSDSDIITALGGQTWSVVSNSNGTLESTTYNSVTYYRLAGATEYYCA